jgi:chemotaxis family two-component system sensor kinase Cph1
MAEVLFEMGNLPHDVKVDLTNCEREPIHIPGQIRAHGVLLALGGDDLVVLQASDNTEVYLGIPTAGLLGKPLSALLTEENLGALKSSVRDDHLEDNPLHLFTGLVCGQGPFHAIGHLRAGLLLLELEPVVVDLEQPDIYEMLKRSVARFQRARSVSEFSQLITEEVRRVSGYDRVMIYRFAPDWSGHVIAESMTRDKGLEPYFDLHYPASDIPSQARALFLLNTIRMLPDARYTPSRIVPEINPRTGKPLDMSFAFLRGASPMYTEYLINMGVNASLTIAITKGDRLWGLIACHHYSPRQIPYDVRAACEFLARVVSLQVADKELHDEADYRARISDVHERLVRSLAQNDDVASALTECEPNVLKLFDCGGAAVFSRGVCHRLGNTPGEPELSRLVEWLRQTKGNEVFSSDALPSVYPAAETFKDTASGILVVPILKASGDYILWMRPEMLRTVKWAGDPDKPMETGPMGDRLTPRKSFALWQDTVRGHGATWLTLELEAARKLRVAMVDVIQRRGEALASVNLELSRSNAELDSFAYVASHDLKEPLRGIYNYASYLLQDCADKLDAENRGKVETIVRLTKRMQALIDSLLHFSRLGRDPLSLEPVDLNSAVQEALESIDARVRESGAQVKIPRLLPMVRADRIGLQEVLVNLLSNALKYSDKADKLIEVGFLERGEPGFPERALERKRCFYIRDNGIGIPAAYREEVFRIFRRLHQKTEYGGGTGAGLTIVRKVVQRHGGEVWCEPQEGGGTTFYFTLGEVE